jgi:hypothetical protein
MKKSLIIDHWSSVIAVRWSLLGPSSPSLSARLPDYAHKDARAKDDRMIHAMLAFRELEHYKSNRIKGSQVPLLHGVQLVDIPRGQG